jgi:hypothetical protein
VIKIHEKSVLVAIKVETRKRTSKKIEYSREMSKMDPKMGAQTRSFCGHLAFFFRARRPWEPKWLPSLPQEPPKPVQASISIDFGLIFKRFFDDFLYQVGYFLSGLPHYFFGYLAKKWGRQQPPCIIASHFTMCVFVWVFERGSLATPFLPSKMKCLFHTAGEILGAPYESVGTLVRQFWYLLGFFRRPQTPDGPTTTTSVTTSGSTTSGSAASAVRPLQ